MKVMKQRNPIITGKYDVVGVFAPYADRSWELLEQLDAALKKAKEEEEEKKKKRHVSLTFIFL